MTKTNWKKEYEETVNKYRKLRDTGWNKKEKWVYSICWMIFTVFLTFLFIGLFGGFDNSVEELGLNEEELIREYTLDFYPEFENCSIEIQSVFSY